MNDPELLRVQLAASADQLESAHEVLDGHGVPRSATPDGPRLSLVGRIELLAHQPRRVCVRMGR